MCRYLICGNTHTDRFVYCYITDGTEPYNYNWTSHITRVKCQDTKYLVNIEDFINKQNSINKELHLLRYFMSQQ